MSPEINAAATADVGRIQVRVLSRTTDSPLENVQVRITHTITGQVVGETVTDESGQTAPVEVPTPPIAFSETPGNVDTSEDKPYTEYNVDVTAPGFESIRVEGVQVLPQSIALQSVRMRALGTNVQSVSIDIPQHTLWGIYPPKILEDDVKPLPDGGGLVVLPQPVVPEYIVVHLGVPSDSSAQNVWVPFKDYIKNVASSEIYSTWPEMTIRANILAINSFVLNRVYTEWYRGKGYNFTITNSTAYDQAFFYGRNIFDEISVLVDELFTTYITRPGIRQPLFTQFCDGVHVQCPNAMSQWGSKSLGDDGADALSILRHYYGGDVYLEQAEKVEGVPLSFPGNELQQGSSGNPVRTIQEQLNSIATHYPAIPKQRVDGIFGSQTETAVKKFQQIFNLPQSGVVDFATWYAISNIYVGINKLAEPTFGPAVYRRGRFV